MGVMDALVVIVVTLVPWPVGIFSIISVESKCNSIIMIASTVRC